MSESALGSSPAGGRSFAGLGARARGFSLIPTLSLLVLLLAVGLCLLSLARIEVAASERARAWAEARSDARLALLLALGQLQEEMGPDQRVSVAADQLAGATPAASGAGAGRRWWTGCYEAWSAGLEARPEPQFRRWLVPGGERGAAARDVARLPAGASDLAVFRGTAESDQVKVPRLALEAAGKEVGGIAWWTADENQKATVLPFDDKWVITPVALRADMMAAPRTAFELAERSGQIPLAGLAATQPALAQAVSLGQVDLLPGVHAGAAGLLRHDLTVNGRGLLVNVRRGGFRHDLSFQLEQPLEQVPKQPLYQVSGQPGITVPELWVYYNLWKSLKTRGGHAYTTGGWMDENTPYLQVETTQEALREDPATNYKQPSLLRCQVAMSFWSRKVGTRDGRDLLRLHLVLDPLVTLWNPLDVPVALAPSWISVKFWMLPYDFTVTLGKRTERISFEKMMAGAAGWHYLTLRVGGVEPVVLKPGEVLVCSQGPGSPVQLCDPTLNHIDGRAGWNFGGGLAYAFRKDRNSPYFEGTPDERFGCTVTPNAVQSLGSRHWSLTHFSLYYKEDRSTGTANPPGGSRESVYLGNLAIDWIQGPPYSAANPKPDSLRLLAADRPDFFGRIGSAEGRSHTLGEVSAGGRGKAPFALYSFAAKSEASESPGRSLARFNPKALSVDFATLSPEEIKLLPYEIQIRPLLSWRDRMIEVSPDGTGYFGGGYAAASGSPMAITHSVPRQPVLSLAAFQHCLGTGQREVSLLARERNEGGQAAPDTAFGTLPHCSHAIGNSLACPMIAPDKTSRRLDDGRILLDHSWLANQALWDDWFLSGIAPQTAAGFPTRKTQRQVAGDFLAGRAALPNERYLPRNGDGGALSLLDGWFAGETPLPAAAARVAEALAVEGMFNVNSTSVGAWKAVLGSLKGRPLPVLADSGADFAGAPCERTAASGLLTPANVEVGSGDLGDARDRRQWVGYRALDDEEIGQLAEALVGEVRKRGPFLSLADFVNRRPGADRQLARAGAVQAALDSPGVRINAGLRGVRSVTAAGAPYLFPEAEEGPISYGMAGCVKQADVLTPIAPFLSARSDSFRIRACGERALARGEKVRAWCEAVVERQAEYLDPADAPGELPGQLNATNQRFGRAFRVVSFRWLAEDDV